MLNEGRRRRERGTDVVVGFVETHGRPTTAAAAPRPRGRAPPVMVTYRGATFEEMDIDALLARAPQVALVDELAHTNVPGSRNAKRWQDIDELLDGGIDVISTVNIQHLESLNDVVERITGIVQRETVPDAVVRAADQIELVDMTPEALRRRMAHGNIYPAEKVDAALGNYFRIGNLGALRELALLWVADRVDEGLEEYRERHGIAEPWETRERVVVALTGAPGGEQLIRRGARMAARAHGRARRRPRARPPMVSRARTTGSCSAPCAAPPSSAGGTSRSSAPTPRRRSCASRRPRTPRRSSWDASHRSRWAELTTGLGRSTRSSALSGPIDVHVISTDDGPDARAAVRPRAVAAHWRRGPLDRRHARVDRRPRRHPVAGVRADPAQRRDGRPRHVAPAPAWPGRGRAAGRPAARRSPRRSSPSSSPTGSTSRRATASRFAHAGDALALVVFVAVSALVSVLVDRLASRSAQLARGQAETEALAELASGTALLDDEALHRLVTELHRTLDLDSVAVLVPTSEGWESTSRRWASPPRRRRRMPSYAAELSDGSMLVGVRPRLSRPKTAACSPRSSRSCNSSRRRSGSRPRPPAADALADANNVRDALLASVSHDLRDAAAPTSRPPRPACSATMSSGPPSDVWAFCKTIDAEADRLHTVVSEPPRHGSPPDGMLGVHCEVVPIDDVVYAALASLSVDVILVDVGVPDDSLFASADPALLERALANVIGNACNWAPDGTSVRVEAARIGQQVDLRVVDRGAGIPRDQREAVFQPFQRLGDGAPTDYDGIGLGLAVTKGFVEAMDGTIHIDDTPGGGATIVITLEAARHEPSTRGRRRPRILKTLEVNLQARVATKSTSPAPASDALELAARHHPDVVILDLGLPGIDGLDVVRRACGAGRRCRSSCCRGGDRRRPRSKRSTLAPTTT